MALSSLSCLCFSKNRFATVNTLGVLAFTSLSGIEPYKLHTSRLQKLWSLKKSNRPYKIKWTILKHSSAYRSGRNQCNLCSDEKLYIMKFKKNSLLNKRSEIFSNCVHQKQFLAGKYIRVQSNNVRHHTRRKNAQACTRKQTKPNG